MEKNNCAVVISSCDAYADSWGPFFTFFFRYWPDCPFRIILIGNDKTFNDPRVTTFKASPDRGWASNLMVALKNISGDYIIYFQEDYFLRKKVDNSQLEAALRVMAETKAAYLRLYPCPGPDQPLDNNQEIGTISRDAAYRNCTQTAIWDRLILLALLKDGETGWDFETGGGLERSRRIDRPFLSFRAPIIDYFCTAIVKGKYVFDALRFCRKEGVKLELDKRKAENFLEFVWRKSGIKQKIYFCKKWLTKK